MNPETTCTLEATPMEYQEDRSLNQRIVRGDEHAFAQLVSRYSTPVYRFLARMLGSSEDAEDLTQETFYAFYKHHRKLREDVDIHPYLFTIARRKAISHIRWRGVRKMLTPLLPEHDNTPLTFDSSPVESLEQERTEQIVQQSLDKLHPDKRAVVILRFFEGMSYAEIAQVLNKPEGTVKSLVFRSEQELRSRLTHRLDLQRGV